MDKFTAYVMTASELKPGDVFIAEGSAVSNKDTHYALIDTITVVDENIVPNIQFFHIATGKTMPTESGKPMQFLAVEKQGQPLTLEVVKSLYDKLIVTHHTETIQLIYIN